MEPENFDIVNWKIENFSCWNKDLHGVYIETPKICFKQCHFKMSLYPRGTSGLEKRMVVYLSVIKRLNEISGDLTFIGADKSTLCTQQVYSKEGAMDFELSTGPKFKEVIVQTGENKSDHKDQLTLRFHIKSKHRYDEHFVYTIIKVFDVALEIDCNRIKEDKILGVRSKDDDNYYNQIHLKTSQMRGDKKIAFYIQPFFKDTFSYSVQTHLRLLSNVGSLIRCENNEHLFHKNKPWTFSDSLSSEELSENVKFLTLQLKIISSKINHTLQNVYLFCDAAKVLPKEKSPKTLNDKDNAVGVLSKELMCLYQDQDFSDLQLKCESVSFPVHRNILSARSTVFKTMLSSDMTEAATGCVYIKDLEAPTLARFLAFLYTGAVEDLQEESALKLYYAADKYNVPSLKRECVRFLSANVCVTNVCDVLSIGDKHQDDELTAAAHNFILRNYNEVLKSKEWKRFMCSEPLLAVKTVTDFAEKGFVGNLTN